nr:F-box protein SKIP23-like [Quercus suber]POE76681.1 f-box protein skip23 [Quercus suber]
MGDWSRLPEGILVLIAKSMWSGSDARRYQLVSTSWRSSVPPPKPPLRLKIPTYDPPVADHFYLVERTIYLVGSPRTLKFYFVKVEEDEHGTMHLLHGIPYKFQNKSGAFQIVLDTLNLNLFEWGKEYVLQYKPKNQAACESLEYDDKRKLAFKRVIFRSLSQDSEEFELLLELFSWGIGFYSSQQI